jgi:hypothetical protein
LPLSIVYPLVRQTALWNLGLEVRGAMRTHATSAAVPSAVVRSDDRDSKIPGLREEYRTALFKLRDTLERRGIPLLLAIYPSHLTVSRTLPEEQLTWIVATARATGVESVNFLEPLRKSQLPTSRLYLLPYDGHPSATGYRIAARALADVLVAGGSVSSSCR